MGLEMALTFLVTGASGFVGSALCGYLREHGHEVRESSRHAPASLEGVDVVVHLGAKVHVLQAGKGDEAAFRRDNVDATLALAKQAGEAGVSRFIFISSIGVHGNQSSAPINEQSPIAPLGGYAQSKWLAEEALSKLSGIETTVLRPPLIYGAGVKANFRSLLAAVYAQKWLPFGAVDNARDYISLRNFCSAIAFCAQSPKAANQRFVLCDGEAISTSELIRRLAKIMHRRAKLLPLPPALLQLGAAILGKRAFYQSVCGSRRIDGQKLRALGWKPEQGLHEGLTEAVQWFLEEVK